VEHDEEQLVLVEHDEEQQYLVWLDHEDRAMLHADGIFQYGQDECVAEIAEDWLVIDEVDDAQTAWFLFLHGIGSDAAFENDVLGGEGERVVEKDMHSLLELGVFQERIQNDLNLIRSMIRAMLDYMALLAQIVFFLFYFSLVSEAAYFFFHP
jgi:hypothetical protein